MNNAHPYTRLKAYFLYSPNFGYAECAFLPDLAIKRAPNRFDRIPNFRLPISIVEFNPVYGQRVFVELKFKGLGQKA